MSFFDISVLFLWVAAVVKTACKQLDYLGRDPEMGARSANKLKANESSPFFVFANLSLSSLAIRSVEHV